MKLNVLEGQTTDVGTHLVTTVIKVKDLVGNYAVDVFDHAKGRAGKGVTIIKGFLGNKEALNSLAKEIKTHLAIGGSTKKGEIILQGRIQEKVINFLKNKGYKTKKVGG